MWAISPEDIFLQKTQNISSSSFLRRCLRSCLLAFPLDYVRVFPTLFPSSRLKTFNTPMSRSLILYRRAMCVAIDRWCESISSRLWETAINLIWDFSISTDSSWSIHSILNHCWSAATTSRQSAAVNRGRPTSETTSRFRVARRLEFETANPSSYKCEEGGS